MLLWIEAPASPCCVGQSVHIAGALGLRLGWGMRVEVLVSEGWGVDQEGDKMTVRLGGALFYYHYFTMFLGKNKC